MRILRLTARWSTLRRLRTSKSLRAKGAEGLSDIGYQQSEISKQGDAAALRIAQDALALMRHLLSQ